MSVRIDEQQTSRTINLHTRPSKFYANLSLALESLSKRFCLGMAQAVEYLPSKCEALSSILSTRGKKSQKILPGKLFTQL
jgi:quinol-cytochrome oxidoreductase complex cytochrome b subunit